MKNFLKNVLASTIGTFIAWIVIAIFFTIAIVGIISFFGDLSEQKSEGFSGEGILHLTFDSTIPDYTNNVSQESFDLNFDETVGLHHIKDLILRAADDEDVLGILLEPKNQSMGFSTLNEIQAVLREFRERSHKPIYAYSKTYTQSQYALASSADSVFLNPNGMVEFSGLGIQVPYFKDMLDKLGVKVEVYYVGDYKSATEPFRRNDMSAQDREQKKEFINDIHDCFLQGISMSRNISVSQLKEISSGFKIRDAEDAINYQFVDSLSYYSDFLEVLKKRLGKNGEKIPLIKLNSYYNKHKHNLISDHDSPIAVVFAEGNIIAGEHEQGNISDDKYVNIFKHLRANDEIEAVVLRVNSGGGSALASDNIWHEIEKLKEDSVKVIVSMGDLAASGGYYISANADHIIAEPSSITGSIGVFGILMNPRELFNEKLGIHFDTVQTGKFTNAFSPFFEKDAESKEIIQNSVEKIYEQFVGIVAEGRGMDKDKVKALAGGRVYSGEDALELGLVDDLGSLNDAIELASELISYDMSESRSSGVQLYPKITNPFQQIIEEFNFGDVEPERILTKKLPRDMRNTLKQVQMLKNMKGVQARMPYFLTYN